MQTKDLFRQDREAAIRNFRTRVTCIRAFLLGVRSDPDPLPIELNHAHLGREAFDRRLDVLQSRLQKIASKP